MCSEGVSFTPNDFSKTVGRKIRDLRKLYGLTQSELGDRIGSPSITVRQWEAGKRLPKLQMLCKVADALGVPVSSLDFQRVRPGLKNFFYKIFCIFKH